MQSKFYLAIVALMLQAVILAQVEVTNYGDIPTQNLPESRWENFSWNDPGGWQIIDVTTKGINPNSNTDIAPILQNLIDNGNGRRIFKFPAGTFNIRSNIHIKKNDVQIVGAGKSTKFLSPGGNNSASITVRGSLGGGYNLTNNAGRGADLLQLNNTGDISVGTYIILEQEGNGPRGGDRESQIVRIISKNGNNVGISPRLGIPFFSSKANIRRFGDVQNVRLSDFYFERTSKPIVDDNNKRSNNIELINARNVEISNIESYRAFSSHINLSRCTEVVIRGSYIHGNYGGGGGTQGGITMNFSSKIYVINNRTSDIRHHIATQFGTDHCVIAYNRAEAPYNSYQDIGQHNSKGCHNNLFEGNYGNQIFDDNNTKKGWGTRYTSWYRNHATDIIGADHGDSNNNNLIGNEFRKSSQTAAIAKGPGNIVAANIFGINAEAGDGNLVWKDLNPGAALPPSLFLKNKPSYLARWPLYGPDATTGPDAIGPDGYTYAVNESETVQISDTPYDVAYGQDGNYEYLLEQRADVNCTNETFGNDPANGVQKYCFVRESKVPYSEEAIKIPGTIEAENYDFGGAGRSYMDTDTENKGDVGFREESGVDIDKGANGVGYAVGWMATGEWLEYTVDIRQDGEYNFSFLVASPNGTGMIGLAIDGEELVTGLQTPQTGGWDSYAAFSTSTQLSEGIHVIRFNVEQNGFNLDKIEVSDNSLSINDLSKDIIYVHPNPSKSGVFSLPAEMAFKVYAVNGKLLLRNYSNKVDLSKFSKGIYILHSEKGIAKLVK